jgi:hypothetical protein
MRGLMKESVRLCPMQVACDGVTLFRGREVCGPCEKALKRRERQENAALRGERCITYTTTRKRRKHARN